MMDKLISQQAAINVVSEITTTMSVCTNKDECYGMKRMQKQAITELANLPSVQPERKTGHWILDRSGAYCCNKCMEPCATYAMMKPRDKFCKMCGSRNEVTE